MAFGDQRLEWWSAGAIAGTYLGDRYAFLATVLGTVGDDVPAADTVEGVLSTLPWDRALLDARGLAEHLRQATPRVSGDFRYIPLDPTQLDTTDGVVFLKEVVKLD